MLVLFLYSQETNLRSIQQKQSSTQLNNGIIEPLMASTTTHWKSRPHTSTHTRWRRLYDFPIKVTCANDIFMVTFIFMHAEPKEIGKGVDIAVHIIHTLSRNTRSTMKSLRPPHSIYHIAVAAQTNWRPFASINGFVNIKVGSYVCTILFGHKLCMRVLITKRTLVTWQSRGHSLYSHK